MLVRTPVAFLLARCVLLGGQGTILLEKSQDGYGGRFLLFASHERIANSWMRRRRGLHQIKRHYEGEFMDQSGGVYDNQYERFFKNREHAQGYEFQHAPSGSVPVPKVTFSDRLRWWTVDRWRRRKKIREARDRRLQEIMEVRTKSQQ